MADHWHHYVNPKFSTVAHVIPCGEDEEVHDCHPRCFCNPRKELIHESYRGEPTMNVVGVMLYHHEGCTPGLTSS